MSKFNDLEVAIKNAIKANGNQEITGNGLQAILLAMVSALMPPDNSGYNRGIANPSTTPTAEPEKGDYYVATEAGEYPNFSNVQVKNGDVVMLQYDGSKWVAKSLGITNYTYNEVSNMMPADTRQGYYDSTGTFVANAGYIATTQPIAVIPNARYVIRGDRDAKTHVILLNAGQTMTHAIVGSPSEPITVIETGADDAFINVSFINANTSIKRGVFFSGIKSLDKGGDPEPWTGIVGGKLLFSTDGTTPTYGIFTPTADKMDFCTTDGDGNRQTTLLSLEANKVTIPVRASFPLGLEQMVEYVGNLNDLMKEGIYLCDSSKGTTSMPDNTSLCIVLVFPLDNGDVIQVALTETKELRRKVGTELQGWTGYSGVNDFSDTEERPVIGLYAPNITGARKQVYSKTIMGTTPKDMPPYDSLPLIPNATSGIFAVFGQINRGGNWFCVAPSQFLHNSVTNEISWVLTQQDLNSSYFVTILFFK